MKSATLVTALLAASGATARAQDLEPRSYSNSPTGLNFLVAGVAYTEGSVLLDPSLPIDNANITSEAGAVAWATTLAVLGQSAQFHVLIPYASIQAEGDLNGVKRERDIDGFGDPLLRFSMNFLGAPAMTMDEFKSYHQDLIFGGSLRIGVPLGQYDNDKIVNVGSNRWSIKPELGVSKAFGPWTVEVAPGIGFYTDNNDFLSGKNRRQSPLYSVQAHVAYSLSPSFWLAFDSGYFNGGYTTIDGNTSDDRQEGYRFGATIAFPISRYQSVKLYAISGFNSHGDHDFDTVGLLWQYRWGGGF